MPLLETQKGWVGFAFTRSGLYALSLPRGSEREALAELSLPPSGEVEDPDLIRRLKEFLTAYFAGEKVKPELPLDMSGYTSFQRVVLEEMYNIPYGRTCTYGQLAARAGRPGAARAVGRVCSLNRTPVVIPCHRVIGANGRMVGFAGGLDMKEMLLSLEGVLSPVSGATDQVGQGFDHLRVV